MKRTLIIFATLMICIFTVLGSASPALAQEATPTAAPPDLLLYTTYPSQVIELGESVTVKLTLRAVGKAQTVQMEMAEIPEGWTATFRGGGRVIQAVYVGADSSESVDLNLTPPEGAAAGAYNFVVRARGEELEAELPITLTVQEKVPASLTFKTDLPTLKGSPTTTFRYSTTLKNEGDEDLTVNLTADTPSGFLAKFTVAGQEVTSFPLPANSSKSISIEIDPIVEVEAGRYPITVYANGGEVQASLELTAEVTGQHNLTVSGPDGRLSGRANAGKETTLQVIVTNSGTAAAQGVEMSATAPTGWTVSFEPEVIAEIPAGGQADVTVKLKPAEKAVAGDYVVTIRARPADGSNKVADFRITVTTSTLWGVVGIALIAIAVGVVALAVTRFGRR